MNQTCPLVEGVDGHCHIWTGARNSHHQPVFTIDHKLVYVAVWKWERTHGPKPVGMQLSPKCGRSMCVNDEHRELRKRGSNGRRKATA